MLKPGDLVIFGDSDAPQAHCIGRLVEQRNGVWHGQYLSKRTSARYSGGLYDTFVTPVSEFGVRVTQEGKKLTVEKVGASIARYPDQKTRQWQEPLPITIETI